MKHFTLLMAGMLMAGTAQAQTQFKQKTHMPAKAHAVKSVADMRTRAKQVREARTPLYKALLEEEWSYEEGEWMLFSTTTLKYDKQGNILTTLNQDIDEVNLLTTYEYNADNLWTSKIEGTSEGEEEIVNTDKQTREYDPIVKDFVCVSNDYMWEEGEWSLANRGRTWIRNITRDVENRITAISVKTLYMGEFQETRKTTITYNEKGEADTWKLEELQYDGEVEEMVETYTVKDMEWEKTDGQITAGDIEDFFTGNNLLKKAVVTEPDYGETGTITASYESDGSYSFTLDYFEEGESVGYDVFTHAVTDENGSYTESLEYYEGDEVMESESMTVTYNSHGDIIKEESFYDGELAGGMQYDCTYENGNLTEWVMNEYSYDDETYLPMMKIVYKNYTDVTTGIKSAVAAVADGKEQAVYNLQGTLLSTTTDNLPAGLYIVKKDGKTVKMIKK